ncbi:MAG: hypothetical protein J6W00_12985 [Lentisphaeria bacterium]|nr:hypothetical protein [Lentisphaeria bacterium]
MKKLSFILALCCAVPLFAEEYKFDTPEAWQNGHQFKKDGERLLVTGQKWMIGKKLIRVPEGTSLDTLKVSGIFRAPEGAKNNTMYIGFKAYDKNRNEFQHVNIFPVAGSETTLAADAKKGENFIMVADASKWQKNQVPVTGAKADLSDLPNYNTLPKAVKIEKAGNEWKVTLSSALKADIAKGTAMRQHIAGGHMYYSFIATKPGVSGVVKTNSLKKMWPHVAFVRFLVLANWRGGNDSQLELIDPKVIVLDPAAK